MERSECAAHQGAMCIPSLYYRSYRSHCLESVLSPFFARPNIGVIHPNGNLNLQSLAERNFRFQYHKRTADHDSKTYCDTYHLCRQSEISRRCLAFFPLLISQPLSQHPHQLFCGERRRMRDAGLLCRLPAGSLARLRPVRYHRTLLPPDVRHRCGIIVLLESAARGHICLSCEGAGGECGSCREDWAARR